MSQSVVHDLNIFAARQVDNVTFHLVRCSSPLQYITLSLSKYRCCVVVGCAIPALLIAASLGSVFCRAARSFNSLRTVLSVCCSTL